MQVSRICRFPVKGLGADDLDRVAVTAGRTLPDDRRFALSIGAAPPAPAGEWQAKSNFVNLAKHEKLGALETHYEAATCTLTISRMGKQVSRGQLSDPLGRAMVEDFFSAYLGKAVPAKPRIIESSAASALTDMEPPYLSLINMASVRDLERIAGATIDPLRFRGNIYFESDSPWCEFDMIGQEIAIGLTRLRIDERIERCAATSVDPETGIRDRNVPKLLKQGFGHIDMGVYATVTHGGDIAIGDAVTT